MFGPRLRTRLRTRLLPLLFAFAAGTASQVDSRPAAFFTWCQCYENFSEECPPPPPPPQPPLPPTPPMSPSHSPPPPAVTQGSLIAEALYSFIYSPIDLYGVLTANGVVAFPFTEVVSAGATQIVDGGSDMYDNGNRLQAQTSACVTSDLPYTMSSTPSAAPSCSDIYYGTSMRNNIFSAAFEGLGDMLTMVGALGGTGADGAGSKTDAYLGTWQGGTRAWQAWRQSISGAGDPSIYTLWVAPYGVNDAGSALTVSHSGNGLTDPMDTLVYFTPGASTAYYTMFGISAGGTTTDDSLHDLITNNVFFADPAPASQSSLVTQWGSASASLYNSIGPYALSVTAGTSNIADGGGDVFDRGNKFTVTNGATGCVSSSSSVFPTYSWGAEMLGFPSCAGVSMSAQFTNGFFLSHIRCNDGSNCLSSVGVTGNAGADGAGSKFFYLFTTLTGSQSGMQYSMYNAEINGAGDPSIEYSFFVPTSNTDGAALSYSNIQPTATTDDPTFLLNEGSGNRFNEAFILFYALPVGSVLSTTQANTISAEVSNLL
mmetsp:Transcript_25213/g.82752  ORF Transcript_25213/g.82752 Transcript_25213/m.82752 type:complete len:543 (-) Transcript_25213:86-1714(-)